MFNTSSFHVCENCDGSCASIARAALRSRFCTSSNVTVDSILAGQDARGFRPDHTPWGAPDYIQVVQPGIVEYETPSHGGWWVAPEMRAKIPACIQLATHGQQGVAGWFEEDMDTTWVVACFPDLFGSKQAEAACGLLSRAFDVLGRSMDTSRARNWTLALRCAYAKNGLAYGWDRVEA